MIGIIETFKQFSFEEFKRFERFINSPYHNRSKKLKNLFKEIKKNYPAFTNKKFNKEYLSKKISPGLKFNDSTFRNIIADFQILVEKFLIVERVLESGSMEKTFLLQSLIEKGQNNMFKLILKKTIQQLKKNGIDHSYYYLMSRFELYKFNYNIVNENKKSVKNIQTNTGIISNYIIYLINFFVTELINSHLKLKFEDFKFNIGEKANFSLKLIETFNIEKIAHLIKSTDKDNFILDMYVQLFDMFQNIDNKHYYLNYKSFITKYYKRFSKDELSYHYSMCISYCVIKNLHSDEKAYYDNELFGIYNTFLKEKLFIDQKSRYIDDDLYRNILLLSLRLRKFNWTLNFITQFSKFLQPEKSKNLINLSFAEYYYHLSTESNASINLNKAFNYLKEIQEESFIVKYDIKILYLMLYYDLGYTENLHTQLKNYRQFLCRNRLVTNDRKKKLNGFLNILEKLVHLKEGDPNVDVSKLNLDIIKLKKFNYQGWLLNKIQSYNVNTSFTKVRHG